MKKTARTIDEYLSALPEVQRKALEALRGSVIAQVPGAQEAIRTRVPAIRYRNKTVVGFGAARRYLSLYVMFGNTMKILRKELAPYDASSRVIRFTPERPLPESVVKKIVRTRLKEIDAS